MVPSAILRTATIAAGRRAAPRVTNVTLSQQRRTVVDFGKGWVGEPDNKIPTDHERRVAHKPKMPKDIPEGLKKDMESLGLEGTYDLDELEESQVTGFQESGLVPPEGAGTFASPILIPSRYPERQVGYTDPVTHAVFWFNIQNDDCAYYVKHLGLFFKMIHVTDEE